MKNLNLMPHPTARTIEDLAHTEPDTTPAATTVWQTTSIKVEPEQWRKVKFYALSHDLKIQDILHQALTDYLDSRQEP